MDVAQLPAVRASTAFSFCSIGQRSGRAPAAASRSAVARKPRTVEELADPEGDDAALAVDGRYLANVALIEGTERRVVTRYRIAAVGIDEIVTVSTLALMKAPG
jgi:hypothetical protein